jgi:hypothetical protein
MHVAQLHPAGLLYVPEGVSDLYESPACLCESPAWKIPLAVESLARRVSGSYAPRASFRPEVTRLLWPKPRPPPSPPRATHGQGEIGQHVQGLQVPGPQDPLQGAGDSLRHPPVALAFPRGREGPRVAPMNPERLRGLRAEGMREAVHLPCEERRRPWPLVRIFSTGPITSRAFGVFAKPQVDASEIASGLEGQRMIWPVLSPP